MKKLAMLLAVLLLCSGPWVQAESFSLDRRAPSGLTFYNGELMVCDTFQKAVFRLEGGEYTRYAGRTRTPGLDGIPLAGYLDAPLADALFTEPWAITEFLGGLAVSDAAANRVRLIFDRQVYTLCGSGEAGSADGTGGGAAFSRPTGLASDGAGNLYVSDTGNGTIRRVNEDAAVTTIARGLAEPMGLCWYRGALYVAETGRCRILRVDPVSGAVTLVAGVSNEAAADGEGSGKCYLGGYRDGDAAAARFDHPEAVAVGEDGTVYVADTLNHAIRRIRDGRVTTLEKSDDTLARFAAPRGLAVQGNTLYAADPAGGDVWTVSLTRPSFDDVMAAAWYAAAVEEAVECGLIRGISDHEFAPELAVTRAMFTVMLSRVESFADGTVIIEGEGTFPDVAEGAWYGPAARWTADSGIVKGIDGSFVPEAPITREQLITMLYRWAGSRIPVDNPAGASPLERFSDAGAVSPWAEEAMSWAVSADILHGDGGALLPGAPATRAQTVTILVQMLRRFL